MLFFWIFSMQFRMQWMRFISYFANYIIMGGPDQFYITWQITVQPTWGQQLSIQSNEQAQKEQKIFSLQLSILILN